MYYVSESDMVKFISTNATMSWNDACSFIKEHDIEGWNGGSALWRKKDVLKKDAEKHYNEESVKWIKAFFEAHPFMEAMMIVFDD